MNKGIKTRKFHLTRDKRRALLRSLAENLVLHGKIETTEARAKELRPFIERWVTKSKNDSVQTRRMLLRYFSAEVTDKLLNEIGPKFKDRAGGYTRITKRSARRGDAAPRAIIEFVE
ncbi:MAG: 50S ribosomal protein L17 [Candidatus Spechtbacterales bacterium]